MNIRPGWCGAVLVLVLASAVDAKSPPPPSLPKAPAPAASAVVAAPDLAASAPPVSLSARKVYEQASSQLVQIRTLLKGRSSQTSVGSGFFVSAQGHIITNFHVVSELALQPERHDLVYVTTDGREAPVQLLMVDVLHDLALLKVVDGPDHPPYDALLFRTSTQPLGQGERMYSMGIPLDVGFAVIEGNYNGLVERSFYPQIFFAGALSAGMSGGPALDQEGRVIGVNVARRVDGEVSFLVPAEFASALLARGRDAPPLKLPAWPVVAEQLMAHQAVLTDRFIRQGWKTGTHPRYTVPVPADRFMRCWGTSEHSTSGGLDFERADCVMDTRVFVGPFTTGTLATRHESYDGRKLGTLRFAARYAQSFRNEPFQRLAGNVQTKAQCRDDFLERGGLPLRAVVCLRAYKKLPKLYDVSVLVATLDQPQSGVLGRFDVQGVAFENAMKLSRHYLEAYGWVPSH